MLFPTRSDLLTPELVTKAVSERFPDVVVAAVAVVEEAHCDTGSASTAARAVLDVDYAPGCDGGLPKRLVLKTVLVRPGAPSSLYRNEVRFYRLLRQDVGIETPRVFASVFDEASGGFGILMEDVRMRSAKFPNAAASMTEPQIIDGLDQLATLHSRFWKSPRFRGDLAWMWTPMSGEFYEFLQNGGREFLRFQVKRSAYKQALFTRIGCSFDEAWSKLGNALRILACEPSTLLHGDAHVGNTYVLPGDRVGLLDWQLMERGSWCHDVAYIMVTSLDIECRRRRERDLLGYYLERLRAGRVPDPPTFDDAWLLYRQAAMWGFLVGWMITPVENYGEAILRANLEKLTAAIEDLETLSALSE